MDKPMQWRAHNQDTTAYCFAGYGDYPDLLFRDIGRWLRRDDILPDSFHVNYDVSDGWQATVYYDPGLRYGDLR